MNKREAIAALAKIIGAVSNLPDDDKEIRVSINAFFHNVNHATLATLKPLLNSPSVREGLAADKWVLSDDAPSHNCNELLIALFGKKEVICQ